MKDIKQRKLFIKSLILAIYEELMYVLNGKNVYVDQRSIRC